MLSAVTVTAQDAQQWGAFLRDFPGAFRSFTDNRAALLKLQPYVYGKHPELRAQYDGMLARANELAPKLATLKRIYDQLSGFFGKTADVYRGAVDATSLAIEKVAGGISAARRALGLGELGIAPLVLAIGAGAALVTIGATVKWITDAFAMSKRMNALMELEAKGYAPEQAADVLNRVLGKPGEKVGGLEATAAQLLWIGGLLLLGWFAVPRILERVRA